MTFETGTPLGVTFEMATPLGRWRHTEWRPPHLAPFVDFLWCFEGTMTRLRERTFPNGRIELIIHLGERYSVIEERGSQLCSTLCIGGMQTGPLLIEAPGPECRVLGVRLHPVGAFALLGRPLTDLENLTVDLEDVVGRAATELEDRCLGASTAEERLRCTADWIAERVLRAPKLEPAVVWAAREIERHHGAVPVSELRERTGLTKTRFLSAFRDQVGVTPKHLARIHRFRRFLEGLHTAEASLAGLALDAGYYDQPHMNAEFRELSGMSPREFLAAARYPNSVSLVEDAA